jgi:RNA ligase (TIGR02306 family)
MTSLASIQRIVGVEKHPNADSLDIAQVKGYKAIVRRDQWKVGDLCIFIEPDAQLPDGPAWSAFYRAKSSRVRAIKLRGIFSFGIIESPANVGYTGPLEVGLDVTTALSITKWEAPQPQDLNASGPYGFGIPKTDEHRWNGLDNLPYGEKVDVTLKIDGQSWSAFCKLEPETGGPAFELIPSFKVTRGVGGRSFLYKPESDNHFTRNERVHGVLDKLEAFCRTNDGVSLCLRGEQYGQGIQKGKHNPHSQLPVSVALFSTWLIDERRYATKGHPLYIHTIAAELGLPTVPVLEKDVILTPELIKRYAEDLETVSINGAPPQPFEGVVIQHAGGSFKVINLAFDARK